MANDRFKSVLRLGTFCGVLALLVYTTGCVPTVTPCTNFDANDDNPCTVDTCEVVDGVATAVNTPVECPEGQLCDPDNGECTEVDCFVDADCDDAAFCTGVETCVDNACVAGVAPCEAGETCNEEEDRCDECVDAADCDDGDACTTDACTDGACVYTDVVCEGDQICDAALGCIDPQCDEDADCDDDDLCTTDTCDGGVCVNAAVVCEDGEMCDPATGDCLECLVDADCADGFMCEDGVCVAEPVCEVDADCDDGLYCNGAETCDTALGECVAGTRPCDDTDADGDVLECTLDGEGAVEYCEEGDAVAVCTPCPTATLDFTLGQDNKTGTVGDDIFNAPLEFNTASGTQVATFQTGDAANGLAGTDVLHASFNTAGTVVPTSLAGIETINITNFATGALVLSATNISGVDLIASVSSVHDLTVTGLQELVDAGFTSINDTTVDASFTFAQTATTAGSTDAFTCTLTDATVGTLTVTTNATNGFETVNIASNGTTANRLSNLTQTTGTTMATAVFTGTADLTVDVMPATVLTYDASAMTGGLTLGAGTEDTTYAEFANPTSNFVSITGGSGNDVILFEDTLATTDFTTGTLDLGDGTDVVQNSFGTTFGAASKMRNVEEVRYNATANGVSVNFSGHTGLTTITNEEDGTANTFTLSNVSSTSGTFPTLNFRGDNTQAAQTYDTITYTATGATGSGDTLNITVGNRGTALNATGTTNVHTMGAITAPNFETLNITVADGPATFGGITATGITTVNITGSSNVTTGTIAPASGVTLTTMNTSAVAGNFNGTFDYVASGATYTGGAGNDTVTFGANSTATSTVVTLGEGNNTFVGDLNTSCADTITTGSGNDTITGGAGADTITVGSGSDTFKVGASTVAEQVIDTITDFTIGEDTITFDEGAIEAANLDANAADNMSDWASADVSVGDAFTIEVITADTTTVAGAVDMAVISDALATFANAAAYIAATSATVDFVGAGAATEGDNFLLAYEDGSGNTRIGVFADDAGAGANSDSFDLGFDCMILSGVNAASLTSATFNVWE